MRTLTLIFVMAAAVVAAHAAEISPSEFKARRAELTRRFPDGIVLLHARADFYGWDAFTFREDRSFYYFFGGGTPISSILALDGTSRETWLFVPTKLSGYADVISRPTPGAETAARFGIEHVAPWEEFVPWIERRLASNPSPVLYVDDTSNWWGVRKYGRDIPESNPPGLDPIVDAQLLWRLSLERRWPGAKVKSASSVIDEMRSIKSPAEIEQMRAAGKATVGAWFRGALAIGNGDSPSQVKPEVVRGCIIMALKARRFGQRWKNRRTESWLCWISAAIWTTTKRTPAAWCRLQAIFLPSKRKPGSSLSRPIVLDLRQFTTAPAGLMYSKQ
jgi:hypothetical protein